MRKLFLLGICIFFFSCSNTASADKELLQKIDSLQIEIAELKEANDTLSDQLMKKVFVTKSYPYYFDTISQPEKFLLEELSKGSNLIPKEAVLGGQMRFTSVNFVNDNYIIAEFEDGHILGKALYSYSLNKNGDLNFNLITQL